MSNLHADGSEVRAFLWQKVKLVKALCHRFARSLQVNLQSTAVQALGYHSTGPRLDASCWNDHECGLQAPAVAIPRQTWCWWCKQAEWRWFLPKPLELILLNRRNPTKPKDPKAQTLDLALHLWVFLHLICQCVGKIVNARSGVYLHHFQAKYCKTSLWWQSVCSENTSTWELRKH